MARYRNTIVADKPLAYWRLGESINFTARDETLNGYSGTYNSSGVTLAQPGAIANDPNTGVLLDGSAGRVTFGSAVNGNGLAAISFEGWFNLSTTSLGSFTNLFQSDNTGGANRGYQLYWASNTSLTWNVGNGTTNATATYTFGAVAGAWWYIVGVYDGATVALWVNGFQHGGTGSLTGSIVATATTPSLGSTTSGGSPFPGSIDEVAIYNYALTSAQIQAHYAAGLTNQPGAYTIYTPSGGQWSPVFVEAGSLTVDNTIGKRSTASFTAHSTDTATHYQQYQRIAVYDQNNALTFAGFVTNPQEQKPGFQASLDHKISCADNHFLADKRIIAKSYTNRTRSSIVQDIVTILSQEGVTVGAIVDEAGNVATLYPGTTQYPNTTLYPQGNLTTGVINATFVYCTVAQALDELTKNASLAGIPYYWSIDDFGQFWWVPYTYVTNANVIDGTLVDQVNGQTSVSRQNPQYRNQQYIIGGTAQTVTQTETKVGDGNATAWTMGYNLASAPTISTNLNGAGYTTKTVGIAGVDTGKDFYWQLGSPVITQDSSGAKLRGPTSTIDLLQVVYTGQFPTVILANNSAQISYQQGLDDTSGIIEEVEQAPTIQSLSDGLAKATGLLSRYAVQGVQLQIEQKGNSAGYAPGQLVTVNLPMHALANTQMLIEEVSASDQRDGFNMWYVIKLVVGPYDGTWVEFFGAIIQQQQPANSINVGASQALVLLQQFTVGLSLSATLTATVYACPVVSTTLYPSGSLYPC